MEDQIEALERSADITGGGQINLANLTDGLRAEREQGITIDVAYRYFATPRRKFIIADTPGHVQYTRNMVTGASTANLSIVLVDARTGVIEQSRRHTAIASLLRIPHLVVAVNKMDLVGWSEAALPRDPRAVRGIPAAARHQGREVHPDQRAERRQRRRSFAAHAVVSRARRCSAISRPCTSPAIGISTASACRCSGSIARTIRPIHALHDFRGFSGQIAGGIVAVGQKVIALPARHRDAR